MTGRYKMEYHRKRGRKQRVRKMDYTVHSYHSAREAGWSWDSLPRWWIKTTKEYEVTVAKKPFHDYYVKVFDRQYRHQVDFVVCEDPWAGMTWADAAVFNQEAH